MKRSLLLSVLFCLSCSRPVPELRDFDKDVWKDDPKACKRERGKYIDPLFAQQDLLKGLSEGDLVGLLGKPDKTDLSEHHEKFYTYYLSPGPECGDSSYTILEIRFNATGVSKEVAIIAID